MGEMKSTAAAASSQCCPMPMSSATDGTRPKTSADTRAPVPESATARRANRRKAATTAARGPGTGGGA
jgi:hypothetical protein